MTIKFGPTGLGPVKDAISNLEKYHELGLKACEIAFTYGPYIKRQEDAKKIGVAAKKLGIQLSIHAPYWINLNSKEKIKIEQSKQRILRCLEIGTWLGAYRVVFHPGFYSKMSPEETYENIKREILDLLKQAKLKKYTPKLAPEVMGKVNVFGSYAEIAKLVNETKVEFCIDFAHILAREKDYSFTKVKKLFSKHKKWHVHFSGIEYSEKGERKHKKTTPEEIKELLKNLPKNKDIVVINESPDPIKDASLTLELSKK